MKRAAAGLALALVACSGGQGEGKGPDAAPSAPELKRAPLALGSWAEHRQGDQAAASFGPAASEASFFIRCDAQTGQVHFVRSGMRPAGKSSLRLITDKGSITLAAREEGSGGRQVEATLPADAPFVTQVLAGNPVKLGVAVDGETPMVMPADPAVARAVRDCAAAKP